MVVIILCCVSMSLISMVVVSTITNDPPIHDVLDLLTVFDLISLHERLKEEYIGRPEQKAMIKHVEDRLRYVTLERIKV